MRDGARRDRILALLAGAGNGEPETRRLCDVGAQITGTTGAGIMLVSGDAPQGVAYATDTVSTLIEELQYGLGEGPCLDAYRQDRPVLEPDLAQPTAARWLAFTTPAVEAGARAIFGFPLRVGKVRLGALDLYRDQPGALTHDQHADALVMADITAEAILALQAGAPPGRLAAELEAGTDLHYAVHQASGMVAAQLEVSIDQALARLRAHAFGSERSLTDVAREVVARRLRFNARTGETGPEQ